MGELSVAGDDGNRLTRVASNELRELAALPGNDWPKIFWCLQCWLVRVGDGYLASVALFVPLHLRDLDGAWYEV